MRNFKCYIADLRKRVFAEVARLAYEGGDYRRMEKLPYEIVPGEVGNQRSSIFLERAIGGEGIRLAMKYVPDVIISDVMMPGMDGIECCRRLKSELQTCHIPVILLTACSLDEQRIQGYDGGADSYISKPFSSQLLLARVRNLIDSHRRLKQF